MENINNETIEPKVEEVELPMEHISTIINRVEWNNGDCNEYIDEPNNKLDLTYEERNFLAYILSNKKADFKKVAETKTELKLVKIITNIHNKIIKTL